MEFLGFFWGKFRDFFGIVLEFLDCFLKFFGNPIRILCGFLGNSIRILCGFLGNSLGILWEFFGNSIGILWGCMVGGF